jgi:hypothetical protein
MADSTRERAHCPGSAEVRFRRATPRRIGLAANIDREPAPRAHWQGSRSRTTLNSHMPNASRSPETRICLATGLSRAGPGLALRGSRARFSAPIALALRRHAERRLPTATTRSHRSASAGGIADNGSCWSAGAEGRGVQLAPVSRLATRHAGAPRPRPSPGRQSASRRGTGTAIEAIVR